MRAQGQLKGGYYPIPPEAMREGLGRVERPDHPFAFLDPCAGEGAAANQIATYLGGTPYAVELSEQRGPLINSVNRIENVLQPCTFEGAAIDRRSFSLIWCNPPYDDELGGGGDCVELTFLMDCTPLLVTGGLMMFALPERVLRNNADAQQHLMANYRNITMHPYPEGHRQYDEMIVYGVKRSAPIPQERWVESKGTPEGGLYKLPISVGPKRFEKAMATPEEI